MNSTPPTPLSYKDAGVDIDAGDALVDRIKPLAKKTMREGVLAGIGGFGALFEVPKRYKEPVLVSGTDGVGTKLKLAFEWNMHDTVGIDLVAMSVNDVLVQGAEPLFFLDYFACGKLDVDTAAAVVGGIARGCELSGCALIGGETAEMPGMYPAGEYDLAGFAVGAVEKSKILTGQDVKPGDVVLGLASAGVHSNGFSLVRKVIERAGADLPATLDGQPFREAVMAPTRLYVKPVLAALAKHPIKALAHITGGGLLENIPRVLPEGTAAHLQEGQLAADRAVRLAAEGGRHRRHRDEPHLQQRHRHGGGDRRGRGRRLRGDAARRGRDGARDRRHRRARRRRGRGRRLNGPHRVSEIPLRAVVASRCVTASYLLMAGALLLIMWQGLLPGLLCVCIGFLGTRWLARLLDAGLRRSLPRAAAALASGAASLVAHHRRHAGDAGADRPADRRASREAREFVLNAPEQYRNCSTTSRARCSNCASSCRPTSAPTCPRARPRCSASSPATCARRPARWR